MEIIKESKCVDVSEMNVEECLDTLIKSMNTNNREYNKALDGLSDIVRDHSSDLKEHDGVICDCVSELGRLDGKLRKKAGKLGLILAVVAGIAYVIKNEIDKDELRFKILEMDKNQCFEQKATRNESEDDSLDSAFI